VIEVGINVLNSTVISIYNPDRFGLSSLHQLRGRVGRGEKPGFCFLIAKDGVSEQAMQRIKIVESTNDGFEIAEADLKNRGEGNLFGSIQSGHMSDYRIANIFEHFSLFERVSSDLSNIHKHSPEILNKVLIKISDETKITSTI
jgi:ATP-dependent DNA helicase RecG